MQQQKSRLGKALCHFPPTTIAPIYSIVVKKQNFFRDVTKVTFPFFLSVEAMNFERPLVTDMNITAGTQRFNGWSSRADQNEDTMEVCTWILRPGSEFFALFKLMFEPFKQIKFPILLEYEL